MAIILNLALCFGDNSLYEYQILLASKYAVCLHQFDEDNKGTVDNIIYC